jgi:hypothetical protein
MITQNSTHMDTNAGKAPELSSPWEDMFGRNILTPLMWLIGCLNHVIDRGTTMNSSFWLLNSLQLWVLFFSFTPGWRQIIWQIILRNKEFRGMVNLWHGYIWCCSIYLQEAGFLSSCRLFVQNINAALMDSTVGSSFKRLI